MKPLRSRLSSSPAHLTSGVSCSTAAKVDAHWINAALCPANQTLCVNGEGAWPWLAWTLSYHVMIV